MAERQALAGATPEARSRAYLDSLGGASGLALGILGGHGGHVPAVAGDTRCTGDAGSRPWWMGVDQYDPCRCRLDQGHAGACWCEHLGTPDPRTADHPLAEPTEENNRG